MDFSNIPVLIIDDDDSIRQMIEQSLRFKGFKLIDYAGNGLEVIQKLQLLPDDPNSSTTVEINTTHPYEVGIVILDMVLPDMNGFDLCKRVKSTFPDAIILMISGFDIENLQQKIIDSEADDFLTKPFNPLELVARISMLLEKKQRSSFKASVEATANQHARSFGHQVPHIGDQIDNYIILDSLGWGKSSVIYKVVDMTTNETYAIKLLTKFALDFKDIVQRFELEIDIMSKINHPNIVKFYKMGNFDRCPYILMDYVQGVNLEEYALTLGRPDVKVIIKTALQMASAINCIHKNGIIHRDIKLKNIMMEPNNNYITKLTDFGIARGMFEDSGITHDGTIVGTPIYMSPELFQGEDSSIQSDIYAYGVTMYHFITGTPPFSAKNNYDLYELHYSAKAAPMRSLNPESPKEFDKLILGSCMAKDVYDRPESMIEVIKQLNYINKRHNILQYAELQTL